MSYNIFAQPAHTNTNPAHPYAGGTPRSGHLQRVSSMIRGEQMAERLGANLNPATVQTDDVCIYVKPHVKDIDNFQFQGRAWLDIVDGWQLVPLARAHPDVGVIACSEADAALLRENLPNRVVCIPQHHCNFERTERTRQGVKRVGVIGTENAFAYLPMGLERELAARGLELECFSKFYSRQDIIDFYQRIDVQIVWRPYRKRLSNPLKLVNAAAFGVPTVALDEECFQELEGGYYPVKMSDEIVPTLETLSNIPPLFDAYSSHVFAKANAYHIDCVAEMYQELS